MLEPKISVIVSTYNWPEALELVVLSFKDQTYKHFELIIADDGSNQTTTNLLQAYEKIMPFPLIHVWHEDLGYRKTIIHNEAIRKSSGDLLVFIDGDCVVAPDFLKDHADVFLHEKNHEYLCMGRRVELGPKITKIIRPMNFRSILRPWSVPLFLSGVEGDTKNFLRVFSIKNHLMRMLLKADNVSDLLGSNFSIPRSLMVAINGFNEALEHYWGEDADIFLRCRNLGVKLVGKKYFAVEFHLYHERRQPKPDAEREYFERLKDFSYKKATKGLIDFKF